MKIDLKPISVRDLVEGYMDNQEQGIVGFSGKLDIRPAYQREFVYKDTQREAVINTVRKNFPLNVLYWVVTGQETGPFEVLDGQQRIISICQYVTGVFSVKNQFFHNLTEEEKDQILDYKLMVYFCEGSDKDKLDWFQTINIAGEKLTKQELRNSVYTGPWLSDAKVKFSKKNCGAYTIGNGLLSGSPKRQEYLETALYWINGGDVEGYMATHQHDRDANELWNYFDKVVTWVKTLFPKSRKEMKGVAWGVLYNEYKDKSFDPSALELELVELLKDDDVTKKAGAYVYLITKDSKHLNIRAFTETQKVTAFNKQGGFCPSCGGQFDIKDMHADHMLPWSKGGKTHPDNLQMLCRKCNLEKSDK